MPSELKPVVSPEDTLARLDIRLGRVLSVEPEPTAPKPAYRLTVDFGKFGRRTSVGRFTQHAAADLKGALVLGVLNFEPRQIGETLSEVLILGVQFPAADSGEATFLTPANPAAKIGGKVF
jgi:tRNA-binding protein